RGGANVAEPVVVVNRGGTGENGRILHWATTGSRYGRGGLGPWPVPVIGRPGVEEGALGVGARTREFLLGYEGPRRDVHRSAPTGVPLWVVVFGVVGTSARASRTCSAVVVSMPIRTASCPRLIGVPWVAWWACAMIRAW